MKSSRGFTLIEMLVVVGLIALLLMVSVTLFFASLRGNQRISAELIVKQNGDYAISQMSRLIRNARRATCSQTVSPNDTLTLIGNDGGTTELKPVSQVSGISIASNSGSLTQTTTPTGQNTMSVTSVTFTCSTPVDGSPGLVEIEFTIESGAVGSNNYVRLPFSTKVNLRTY